VARPDAIAEGDVISIPGQSVPTDGLRVVTRDEWGAKPFKRKISPLGEVEWVTVHHTATAELPTTREAGMEQARFVQRVHHGQGWQDTGYHALLDQEGTWYTGRQPISGNPFTAGAKLALGSHVGGKNTGNVGLSVMGYFHAPRNHRMTDEATASLRAGLRWMLEEYGLDRSRVRMHQEWPGAATACPGDTLIPVVKAIRDAL
jgi:hypothetical protein